MVSTYSPDLKIQLLGTGDNNTTWGAITNVNLGTAFEESICGTADVTFASGNVTISLTDTNATQVARNMRLNLTGTTGGARNLVVPTIEKVYIVNNTCADAVTVKTVAGTGIAVPAGKTMWLAVDGTNVVDVVTYATAFSVAAGGSAAAPAYSFAGDPTTGIYRPSPANVFIACNGTDIFAASPGQVAILGGAQMYISGNNFVVHTPRTPASSAATGEIGSICWDTNYLYCAVGVDTWKRVALSSW